MTNAINTNATVQTRIYGIGAALRCVAVVGRDVRARHESKRDDLPALTGKRLHPAHASFATPEPSERETVESSASSPSSWLRSQTSAWQRPALPKAAASAQPALAAAKAAQADMYLPPAAWASLVILRAISA